MKPRDFDRKPPFDYDAFRNALLNEASKHGREAPSWDDVWLVMARDSDVGELLRERGVDTAELQRDIAFIRQFGRPEVELSDAQREKQTLHSLHDEVLGDLMEDVRAYVDEKKGASNNDGYNRALQETGKFFEKLFRQEIAKSDPDADKDKIRIKKALLEAWAKQFIHHQDKEVVDTEVFKEELNDLMRFIFLKRHVSIGLGDAEDSPLALLDNSMGSSRGREASAINIFNLARDESSPLYLYLLARNGMVMPEDYKAPCKILPREICKLGLNAHELAAEKRDRTVTPMHLAEVLLDSPSVQAAIRELVREGGEKVKDQEKKDDQPPFDLPEQFSKVLGALRKQMEEKEEQEERFRVQVKVPDKIQKLLQDLADLKSDESKLPKAALLFGKLLEFPEVKKLLTTAGISEESLDRWSEIQTAYRDKQEKLGNKLDEDENPLNFKVSSNDLEEMIKSYGRDLTKEAAQGRLPPVIGRQEEIAEVKEILCQKTKKNAVLLGEPGVGKTAVFAGLAQDIIHGKVPPRLMGAKVIEIDLQAMNAGAMYRGQFEERLKTIIDGVAERNASGKSPPIILCIDELHAALMSGTASGTPGASEMLKPALTRGDLYVVGATTEREWRSHIEKDGAISRRFQPVSMLEPSVDEVVEILKGHKPGLETHHGLTISDDHLRKTATLSRRYISGFSPDRDISVLDNAAAKAAAAGAQELHPDHILAAIAKKGRLGLDFLKRGDAERTLQLPQTLSQHVLGQEKATNALAAAVIKAKAGLHDPKKPLGSFIFLGPTGVGKTESAKALALNEFGTEDALIRIDMGEFQEKHSLSRLIGAPPGYVGYEGEGELTGKVSRRPHSVVLLDEVDKAHPDVFDALLTAVDEGYITDGQGRKHSLKNTYIIMTTNHPNPEQLFRPEMYNRFDKVIGFDPLSQETIIKLVDRNLDQLEGRMMEQFHCHLVLSEQAKRQLAQRGYDEKYGARMLTRAVDENLTNPIAPWLLTHQEKSEGKYVVIRDLDAFHPVFAKSKESAIDFAEHPEIPNPLNSIEIDGLAHEKEQQQLVVQT